MRKSIGVLPTGNLVRLARTWPEFPKSAGQFTPAISISLTVFVFS